MVVGAIVGIIVGVVTRNPYAGFAVFSAIAGVGSALFPTSSSTAPPKPGTLQMQTSQYGGVIPVVYGSAKLAGNCLWYDNFQSSAQYAEAGKGGGGEQVTGYTYSVSLAWGICLNSNKSAGTNVRSIWKGKDKINLAKWIADDKVRIYDGTQTEPDSHMAQFLARDPVWTGLTYVVFPSLDLGNSPYVPNFTFEIGVPPAQIADVFIHRATGVYGGTDSDVPFSVSAIEIYYGGSWHDVTDVDYWYSYYPESWNGIGWDSILSSGTEQIWNYTNMLSPEGLEKFKITFSGGGELRIRLHDVNFYDYVTGLPGHDDGPTFSSGEEIVLAPPPSDVPPSDVTEDMLNNSFYGMGLHAAFLDSSGFAATRAYCTANDLLISPVFNSQVSVLDFLEYIINHHDGFITYYDGILAHRQLKTETPAFALTSECLVQKDDTLPVQISRSGARDYYNKVGVEYTKRENEYVQGTVIARDDTDIDLYGTLDKAVSLPGFMTTARAAKMAYRILRRSLLNPRAIQFSVGPKSSAIRVGDIGTITDPLTELSAQAIRIHAVRENDNYEIEVESFEESDRIYEFVGAAVFTPTGTPDPGDPGSPASPDLNETITNVLHPTAIELPPYYSPTGAIGIVFSKTDVDYYGGAALHRAFSSGGTYESISTKQGGGRTGTVQAVGSDYITIDLDNNDTLVSAVDWNELWLSPLKNLIVITTVARDIFVKFGTAELLSARRWKLTDLIFDITETPVLDHVSGVSYGDLVGFYGTMVFSYPLLDSLKYRTLFFKVAATTASGYQQSLADCTEISEYVDNLAETPRDPCNIKVNDVGIGSAGSCVIGTGNDVDFTWMSRNRFGTGWNNSAQTDAVPEDPDFSGFLVEIYSGALLKRTATVTDKSWSYTVAMQSSDSFTTGTITAKIYQMNSIVTSPAATVTVGRA